MEDIIIGVSASIIASIILWVLSQLYSFNTRRKVEYKLMLLRNDNYNFQKFLEYRGYDLSLYQLHRMLDEIGDLYSYIKLFTYFPFKKKLIYTLLNNLHYILSEIECIYLGYDEKIEKEACCESAENILYKVGYIKEEGCEGTIQHKFQSISEVTVELLSELNTYKSVKKIMISGKCFNGEYDKQDLKKFYLDLIVKQSFRDSFSKKVAAKYFLTSSTLDRKAYKKLVDSL